MMVERDVTGLDRIAAELADHKRMQEISTRLIHSDDVQTLFRDLVDAAIEITQADGGTLESREDTDDLCVLEARNVDPKLREAFARVGPNAKTSCAYALRRGERVTLDYAGDDEVAGTSEARAHREAGVRTAQSTPLVARSGRVVGMLSTHWTRPHQLTERQADLLDMLARQAADLIERTETEQALRDSERRYRTLFDSIDEGFCILEMLFDETQKPVDQRFLEINPAFTRHTGITDVVGKTAREAIPDLEEHWFEIYGRVALTGEPIRFTHRSEAMDRWFDVYAFRVGDPDARKVALLFQDVTRQKQSERDREQALAEVRAEQERLGEVFHYAPSFMTILRGPDHVFERANDLYMQLVGKRDLIGRPVREVLPEVEAQGYFEVLDHVYRTGEPYVGKDVRIKLRREQAGGETEAEDRWIDLVYQPLREADGSVTGIFVQGVDLTERKRTENALRENQERLRFTLEATDFGTWELALTGPEAGKAQRSPKHDEIFGYDTPLPEWTFEMFIDHVIEDDRDHVKAAFDEVLRKMGQWDIECRIRRADDGQVRWIWAGGRVLEDGGEAKRMLGLIQDITDRKRMEQKQRESEQRFRMMADSAPVLIWMGNDSGDCTYVNKQWLDFTGRTLEEEMGDGWAQRIHPEDKPQSLRIFAEALEAQQPFRMEYRLRHADGEYRWLLDLGLPRHTPDGSFTGFIGSCVDITDRRQMERELQQFTQTLEQRVAERTAEAEHRAHQLQVMAKELTDAEHRERRRLAQLLHDDLQQILVAAKLRVEGGVDDAGKLIEQAIDTTRSLSSELAPPVLYDVGLRAAMEWLARWVRDKYRLHVEVESDGSEPVEDEQLRVMLFEAGRELLLNVVKHAKVTEARVTLQRDDERVRVQVEDPGVGFDPVARRADATQGGLGLFSLQERLEIVGGQVAIDSAPGKGTRIQISLPLTAVAAPAEEPEADRERDASAGEAVGGATEGESRIRVLLTDDHSVVRRGLANLIEQQPDVELVAEAASGEEAVELARRHRPDVVVMDISLPGISGIEATRRIMAELPSTCTIGLSVHEQRDVADAMQAAGARAYFSKSEAVEYLVDAIRRLAAPAPHRGRPA